MSKSDYNELNEEGRPPNDLEKGTQLSQIYDRISPGKDIMRGSEKVGVLQDPRKSDIERISVMVS